MSPRDEDEAVSTFVNRGLRRFARNDMHRFYT